MSKIIATIKLAPGKVAFYDEYSHIHLTIANPIAYVYEDTPLKRIKASIKSGTLRVINGNLINKDLKKDDKTVPAKKPSENNKDSFVIDEPKLATTEPTPVLLDEDNKNDSVVINADEALTDTTPIDAPVDETHQSSVTQQEKTTKKGRKKSASNTDFVEQQSDSQDTAE